MTRSCLVAVPFLAAIVGCAEPPAAPAPAEVIANRPKVPGVLRLTLRERKKPAPDMIFAALERLSALPEDAVLVGDSLADVACARAAGLPVGGVRGGYTTVPVNEMGADIVIGGLAGLPAALDGFRVR